MGNLLARPITEKMTEVGQTSCGLVYGASSMQGWRNKMEDAHICQPFIRVSLNQSGESGATKKRKRPRDDNGSKERAGSRPCFTLKVGSIERDTKSGVVSNKMDCSDAGPEDIADNAASENDSIILKGHSVFAVFDGHGGQHSANFSSQNFVKVLTRQEKFHEYAQLVLDNCSEDGYAYKSTLLSLLEDSMREAFMKIDQDLLNSIKQKNHEMNQAANLMRIAGKDAKPELDASGTTAVVVLLTPLFIVCANAGDSRAVYSKSGGKVTPLSYDHKPNDEYEQFRIVDAGGTVSDDRIDGELAVSRALGDLKFKGNSDLSAFDQKVTALPDVITKNRCHEEDEFVLIACDGVWDVQTNQEAVTIVHEVISEGERNLGMICEEMLDLCLLKGSKDNMTALMIKFPGFTLGPSVEGDHGVLARRRKRLEAERELNQATGSEMPEMSGK